ncbi:Uncharacterised protein [Serratia plymuthica]|uniref:Uncharacterized protein n=1 Tax=Serratia plymuthica TaxID=82996 RepID=A0A2X4UXJ1_SERPL|nr:Uncharacterised protein [Serratia plymuthica]
MTAYGDEGVALGSLYLTVTVILFNVLSVITLTRSLQGGMARRSAVCRCCAALSPIR